MGAKMHKTSKATIVSSEASAQALAQYCPDLDNWPSIWRYEQADIAPGQRIVEYFKPFLLHLLAQGFAAKTLRRHRDHLWMLGGEVIKRRQQDSSLRRKPVEKIIFDLIDDEGGPLIWPQIAEQEQEAFDATCRKLYKFITAQQAHGK